jgi:hypothetical protein
MRIKRDPLTNTVLPADSAPLLNKNVFNAAASAKCWQGLPLVLNAVYAC